MIKRKAFFLSIAVSYINIFGCSQERTYLSEEIKSINPYKVGQQIIFVSNLGVEDTLTITKVEGGRFPDAIGAPHNEHFAVDVFRRSRTDRDGTEERILSFLAGTDKEKEQIDFSISLKETALVTKYVSLEDYKDRASISVDTEHASYDDVLVFENRPNRQMHNRAIVEFWWSKSKGYIRLVQKDGTIWDLRYFGQN